MGERAISARLVGACLLWAAGPAALASELPRRIQDRGALEVLVTRVSGRNEFFTLGPGERPGFDRELLEGFCRLHGLELVPVPVDGWDELVPALLAGRGDLIAGRFTATEARRKSIDFTAQVSCPTSARTPSRSCARPGSAEAAAVALRAAGA